MSVAAMCSGFNLTSVAVPAYAAAVSSTVSAEVFVQCTRPETRSRLERIFSLPPGFFFCPPKSFTK